MMKLPARLLDWTRIALPAGYFAAIGAAKRDKAPLLSVWAFRAHFAMWASERLMGKSVSFAPAVEVVTAPRASNPNLHAQAGVFTVCDAPTPFDEAISKLLKSLDKVDDPWPGSSFPLIRFDIPATEAPKLLRLLAYEQVDAARMFPRACWSGAGDPRTCTLR